MTVSAAATATSALGELVTQCGSSSSAGSTSAAVERRDRAHGDGDQRGEHVEVERCGHQLRGELGDHRIATARAPGRAGARVTSSATATSAMATDIATAAIGDHRLATAASSATTAGHRVKPGRG